MRVTKEEEELMKGLLASIRKPAMPLVDKMSIGEHLRRWAVIICVCFLSVSTAGYIVRDYMKRVDRNTTVIHEVRGKVWVMWWMKEQGLTNADLKEKGIHPPDPPNFDQ